MVENSNSWRRCSNCKADIGFDVVYWVCNVSTCNRKRTGLVFCTVTCWEVHLPEANHRESWAVEATAPRVAEPEATPKATPEPDVAAAPSQGRRRIVREPAPAATNDAPREILIVASRLKDYVRAKSGMNTSERVLEPLSRIVRQVCDRAIRSAERDGRRTVLDRDIPS